jgi:ribokinase
MGPKVRPSGQRRDAAAVGRVLVAGSINMDVVAMVDRHPAPGETVPGLAVRFSPGGKGANQAVAAARAGAAVTMLGAVGSDPWGAELTAFLASAGVDVAQVARRPGVATGTALVVVALGGENSIVVVPGANGTVDEDVVGSVTPVTGDVLVAQHEVPAEATAAFLAGGKAAGATCVLNAAPARPVSPGVLAAVDVLVVNEVELAALSGGSGDVAALRALGFGGCAVVTLGAAGAVALDGKRVVRVAGRAVEAVDTTGAGDCFVGSLAAELAARAPLEDALAYANAAAALSVQRPGAGPSVPQRHEVEAIL